MSVSFAKSMHSVQTSQLLRPGTGARDVQERDSLPEHGAEQARTAHWAVRRAPRSVRVDSERGGAALGQFATHVRIESAQADDRGRGRSPGPGNFSCDETPAGTPASVEEAGPLRGPRFFAVSAASEGKEGGGRAERDRANPTATRPEGRAMPPSFLRAQRTG